MNYFIISIFLSIFSSLTATGEQPAQTSIERRAAIDVGSGSTKVTIADVDTDTQKIVNILFESAFPVPYQASLESSYDGSFDTEIRELGTRTFRQIKEIADSYQVEKVAAVATAAFRNANNGESFAKQVERETGIPLGVISQNEEGKLAFFSGLVVDTANEGSLLVWDIGTGSFQLSTLNNTGNLAVFMGEVGSVPFKNYIIEVIQGKNPDNVITTNPMTEEEVKNADSYARSLARKASPLIKDKIKQAKTKIVGIGRLFSNSIGPMVKDDRINRDDLRSYITHAIGLTDEEQNNPYAYVDLSNAILVLGFMKALHIQEVEIVDSKSTRGMLIYTPYWSDVEL